MVNTYKESTYTRENKQARRGKNTTDPKDSLALIPKTRSILLYKGPLQMPWGDYSGSSGWA